MKRACVFVDGENFRHSLRAEFRELFGTSDYLPERADWARLYDWMVHVATSGNAERLRTYWYVVNHLDPRPFNVAKLKKSPARISVLRRDPEFRRKYAETPPAQQAKFETDYFRLLGQRESYIRSHFDGWTRVQEAIAGNHNAIEFRREGTLKYCLHSEAYLGEKGVDVKLATDMITLKDIYDVAVLVSGDQDYVPAVKHIKDLGKTVVNVAFCRRDGRLIPGGARRLNHVTDWSLEVPFERMNELLGGTQMELIEKPKPGE